MSEDQPSNNTELNENKSVVEDQIEVSAKRLPDRPVFMSMILTHEGKPIGYPIWNSFVNVLGARSLNNETLSSTFMSLAKTLSDISTEQDKEGKIMKVSVSGKTFNIFTPHPQDDFQIAFAAVFEERDNILIKEKHKDELVKKVLKELRKLNKFREYIVFNANPSLDIGTEMYDLVDGTISKAIRQWDKKRVKYLKK